MLILPLLLWASVSSPEGEEARADDSQGPTTADMLRTLGSSLVPIPPSRALEPNFRNKNLQSQESLRSHLCFGGLWPSS